MVPAAASFEVKGGGPAAIVAAASRVARAMHQPACLLVFSSGKHAKALMETATGLESRLPGLPKLLLSGPGVLSDQGELEGQDATTGLLWSGGSVQLRVASHDALSEGGVGTLTRDAAPRHSPVALFIRSEHFKPDLFSLNRLREQGVPPLFGAATHGNPGIIVCDGEGIRNPSAVCVHTRGLGRPKVQTTHSCRLLAPPVPITRCDGPMVFELGGEPALTVLERLGARLSGRPLLFTVLCEGDVSSGTTDNWLVRGIQGIDPGRRALVVSPEVRQDMLMTFAVKDSLAAREDLERRCRAAANDLCGAAPRFGVYFNCSGRGRNLHASAGVDTRILKERFPQMPFAGMQSAFEIAPFAEAPAFQIFTGVLGLFSLPS